MQQNGKAASATTIARKRSVFANVIRYAVEKEGMPSNPLDRMSWKPPRVSEVVDRRVVVNPRQARELLTAVTYVGQQRRGPHARGQRLMAFYACMYYAALPPAEVVGLRRQDCHLPETGWGLLDIDGGRSRGTGPIIACGLSLVALMSWTCCQRSMVVWARLSPAGGGPVLAQQVLCAGTSFWTASAQAVPQVPAVTDLHCVRQCAADRLDIATDPSRQTTCTPG